MIKEAIEKIEQMAKPEMLEKYGLTFSNKKFDMVKEPKHEVIVFNTLSGFCDFVKRESNKVDNKNPVNFIQVVNHKYTILHGLVREDKQSNDIARSNCGMYSNEFPFNRFMSQEDFMIGLLSNFKTTMDLKYIVEKAGTVSSDSGLKTTDDGVTQQVECKQNIALKENVELKKQVALRPYRTFREIEQPESLFLFRVRKSRNDAIEFALFEADGATWKLEAIKNIAKFIKEALPEISVLA